MRSKWKLAIRIKFSTTRIVWELGFGSGSIFATIWTIHSHRNIGCHTRACQNLSCSLTTHTKLYQDSTITTMLPSTMKHFLFLVVVFGICCGFDFSGSGIVKHGPLLVIDTSSANFGSIPNTGYSEHFFVLHNAGDSALRIKAVYPACGCTLAMLKDSTLLPGDSTSLQIRFQEEGHRAGGFSKQVEIISNSRDTSRCLFTFYGRFVGESKLIISRR
jgi:hypothetical protein